MENKDFITEIRKHIESRKPRSAWKHGVQLYAYELLENVADHIKHHGRNPVDHYEMRKWALNGAENWAEYSCGSCTLVYNEDIAERLCTPKNAEKCLRKDMDWLKVQECALYEASGLLRLAYHMYEKARENA